MREKCVWMAGKVTEWPFQARAELQNRAIGWLRKDGVPWAVG